MNECKNCKYWECESGDVGLCKAYYYPVEYTYADEVCDRWEA